MTNLRMMSEEWPPDYIRIFEKKVSIYNSMKSSNKLRVAADAYYKEHPVDFIMDWLVTYDPRNARKGLPTLLPFLLFKRQVEFIEFLDVCMSHGRSGLCEKCRDVGLTWLCCAYSVWMWKYIDGSSIGWGSRKAALVHRLGDMDSIFEKIRMLIRNMPPFFLPKGYDERFHFSMMKIINPETGSTITGEAGDEIGRGGRKSIYFKDESAHYERPDKIEAALADNTDVQIDISSVNGSANVFYRRRMAGQVWTPETVIDPDPENEDNDRALVFIFDWREHPGKSQSWYNHRRKKAEREGLLHVFAQEVDRDYASSVEGILIKPEWIKAAIDAHLQIKGMDEGIRRAALDVADEGGDKNAYTERKGVVLNRLRMWGQGDTGETARKSILYCKEKGIKKIQYDGVGVGSGVKAETNRMIKENIISKDWEIVSWLAGGKVLFPKHRIIKFDRTTPTNQDFYANLKAQAGWQLRLRFEKTYKVIVKGEDYPVDELISIDSNIDYLDELETELSQPTWGPNGQGKVAIDKKPDGSLSPNSFDSVSILYWPITKAKVLI